MELLHQTKFLNFTRLPSTGKTLHIGVGNNQGHKLAFIKWDTGWRRYVFLPLGGTQYDVSCLKDIEDFITDLMEKRKQQ